MIQIRCPDCGKTYKVKDELAGKAIRCRDCQGTIRIPAMEAEAESLDFESEELEAPPLRSAAASPDPASRPRKKKTTASGNTWWKWLLGLGLGFMAACLLCCAGVFWAGSRFMNQLTAGVPVPAGQTFDQWRSSFKTKLVTAGPSTQPYETEVPPENVTEVTYPSGALNLKAWVYRPPGVDEPRPALVFFHGGFAFGEGDLTESCTPFMEAGYVVMAPMLRGENGNPGNYELFFGEVDDARAACQWLAKQPYVQADRIYTFGHSVGGGVSAVLSLLDNVPIRHGGSSGGLYNHSTFLIWQLQQMVPFENTPQERSVRLLIGNTAHMQHKHYAFIGSEDDAFESSVAALQTEPGVTNGKLIIETVPGDHFDSFDESIRKYLQIVQQEK